MTSCPHDATKTTNYFSGSTTPSSFNSATDKTDALSVHVTIAHNIQKLICYVGDHILSSRVVLGAVVE